jgi:ABC-type oligopeptide transport system substrate-binding subunit
MNARVHHSSIGWSVILLVWLLVGFLACWPEAAYNDQHLRIGLGSNPETLDPHRAAGGPEDPVLLNLFEGLTEYDPETAAPVPALAERWDVNADATAYTFYLKPGARWSNNDPVTAHDFVYSWRRALNPATASPYASMLYPIRQAAGFNQGKVRLRNKTSGEYLKDELGGDIALSRDEFKPPRYDPQQWEAVPIQASDVGVEAIDQYTLRVTLEHPTAYFLNLTPHCTFRPVHGPTVERWGQEWTKPEHLVMNGPYRLVQWQPGDKLVLQKNQGYRDASRVQIERVTFFLAEDTTALLNLYQVGDIDTMVSGLLPVQHIPRLRGKRDYVSGPFLSLYYYMMNVTRPPLDNARVRQALNFGLNRRLICDKLLQAGQQPAHTLTPGNFGGTYPRPEGPGFDAVQAQQLMSQAGYPNGRGLRLRVTFSSLDIHRQIAEAIQAQWLDQFPEMQVELVNLEWQVFLEARRQRDFDLALRHWIADYNDPYSFLELMLSDSSNNFTGWSNPNYDRLVQQANATIDPGRRLNLLAEAERLVLEELPFIPIYEGVTFFLRKPYVRGWETNILDKHPLKFVWIERK